MSKLAMSVNGGIAEIPPDIIAHTNDMDTIVQNLLERFKEIGDKLLCLCMENLPAATPSDAIHTTRKTLSSEEETSQNLLSSFMSTESWFWFYLET